MSLFPFRQTHLMSLHPREAGRWDPAPRPHRGPRTAPECSTRPAQQPGADSRLLVSLSVRCSLGDLGKVSGKTVTIQVSVASPTEDSGTLCLLRGVLKLVSHLRATIPGLSTCTVSEQPLNYHSGS